MKYLMLIRFEHIMRSDCTNWYRSAINVYLKVYTMNSIYIVYFFFLYGFVWTMFQFSVMSSEYEFKIINDVFQWNNVIAFANGIFHEYDIGWILEN